MLNLTFNFKTADELNQFTEDVKSLVGYLSDSVEEEDFIEIIDARIRKIKNNPVDPICYPTSAECQKARLYELEYIRNQIVSFDNQ